VPDEDPVVSRRQFFRGVTGDLLRAISEVSGIDRLEERLQEQPVVTDVQGYFSPERQSNAITDIFGFLEHMGSGEAETEEAEPGEHESAEVGSGSDLLAGPEPAPS
jgi:hypothetical protein